jgi:hypothetical protein
MFTAAVRGYGDACASYAFEGQRSGEFAMAKKATSKGAGTRSKTAKKSGSKTPARAVARPSAGAQDTMGEAFIKLLQSPLVAELVAVAATAALASLAEQGFSNRAGGGGSTGKRAGRAVKAAGAAAAAAIGRRLTTEIDEIRKAAKQSKAGAKG